MVEERSDGAVVVELSFAGVDWLVREILREAGDAAVLEPKDAREAVREAVGRLSEAQSKPARRARQGPAREAPAGLTVGCQHMNRREQIKMSGGRGRDFLAEERTVTCATIGPARLAAPDAAVVRAARALGGRTGPAPVVVDVRLLAEGAQPRARAARDAAGRGRRAVRASCAA